MAHGRALGGAEGRMSMGNRAGPCVVPQDDFEPTRKKNRLQQVKVSRS
jgi:hypothetical protein